MKKSLSVIIPAYNEEERIKSAISHAIEAVKNIVEDYEIIVINDGSQDKTGKIIDELASKNKKIKAFHNKTNKGLGYTYFRGVKLSKLNYVICVAGDDETDTSSFPKLMSNLGKKDMIIPYIINKEVRSKFRIFISEFYIHFLNLLFRMNLKCYTSCVILKRESVAQLENVSHGFNYSPEILITLVKSGNSYEQVPITLGKRASGKSSLFKPSNIISIFFSLIFLIYKIYFTNMKKGEKNSR